MHRVVLPQACHLFPAGAATIAKEGFETFEVREECLVEVSTTQTTTEIEPSTTTQTTTKVCIGGIGNFGSGQDGMR